MHEKKKNIHTKIEVDKVRKNRYIQGEEKEVSILKKSFLSPYENNEEHGIDYSKILEKRDTGPKCI